MADDRADDDRLNVFDTLLMPLRMPGRVISDFERVASAVVSLQSDAKRLLSSVDDRAGELVDGLRVLQGSIDRIEGKVDKLEKERMDAVLNALGKLQVSIEQIDGRIESIESIEESLTDQLNGLRADLNARMISVEEEVRAMRSPMGQMASDVSKIDGLLPDPSDGPLTRLKDTLTPG